MFNETDQPAAGPFHKGSLERDTFAVIDALNGFARLERRGATLNGNVPLQGMPCKPFLEGNEAGVHVRFVESLMISRDPEMPSLQMTDEAFAKVA